jgi:hypothetical protein
MTCHEVMDKIIESSGEEPLPLFTQAAISLHLFFCPRCAEAAEKFETLREIMKNDFYPPSPGLEERIMAKLAEEAEEARDPSPELSGLVPGGISTRGWVLAGFFILLSLATSFFGIDFIKVADAQGSSFLLPVGLTIGAVLTGYGAFFIASHLKELSARFRLH